MATQIETNKDQNRKTQPVIEKTKREIPARALPLGPFTFIRQLFDDIERMWGGGLRRRSRDDVTLEFVPEIEVSRRNGKLVVKADLPGLSPEDVEITVLDDALIIAGERRSEHEEEDEQTWRCERSYGAFRRAVPLPDGADPGTAEAHFDSGVLEITMNAAETGARGRKLEIRGQKLAH
jgi:HSP20 family protein